MRFCLYICCILPFFLISVSSGQTPRADATFSRFFSANNHPEPTDIQAKAWIYSDGGSLTVIVEVQDPEIRTYRTAGYSDHIQLWIGLDESAFPEPFPHATHPHYVGALYASSIDRGAPSTENIVFRTFAPQYKVTPITNDWVRQTGFPDEAAVRKDSLEVPPASKLRSVNIPFGMVHYALFPDERPAQLLDRGDYQYLETAFNREIGDWASKIKYDVDTLDHQRGYIVSAHVPVEALGFARIPRIDALRIMIAVANAKTPGQPAELVAYSQPDNKQAVLAQMTRVAFAKPIRLNPSGIPDEVFTRIGWYPAVFLSRDGWTAVQAESGALVWRRDRVSHQWQETRFSTMSVQYKDYRPEGFPLQRLTATYRSLNMPDVEKDFVLLPTYVERLERSKGLQSDNISDVTYFRFADGAVGLILKESNSLNPYGWGECGNCLQERMKILRMTPEGVTPLVKWEQSEGPEPGFRIAGEFFPGFYLNSIDQIKGPELMVLALYHRDGRQFRRIKLSWDEKAKNYTINTNP
ncbi:MAG: hypothetical protein NWR72_13305 [Bacteroidia bacterium]|nr:hypothetical protein [Bacteroidia bacterium]